MASISGSNGSGQEDTIRRNREEYQKKESELVKRHQREIRRLSEAHVEELDRLNQERRKDTQRAQKQSTVALTKRDSKYQRDMDDLRKIHQRRVGELKAEHQRRIELERKSSKANVELVKETGRERARDLITQYERTIQDRDRDHVTRIARARESQTTAITSDREKLIDKHNTELERLIKNRNRQESELKRKFSDHRSQSRQKLQDAKINGLASQERVSNIAMAQISRERIQHDNQMTSLRVGFQDGLAKVREKHLEASEQERFNAAQARADLKNRVDGRMNNQVHRLENKLEDLKTENMLERQQMKQIGENEKSNLKTAFKANIDKYERDRLENLNLNKQQHARDMIDLQTKNDQILSETSRFHMGRREEDSLRNKKAFNSLENEMQIRIDQKSGQAQLRVDSMVSHNENTIAKLQEDHKNSIETIKEDYTKEKSSIILKMENDKEEALQRLRNVVKNSQIKSDKKEAELRQKYEKRIASMVSKNTYENQARKRKEQTTLEGVARANKDALEMQQVQFNEKANRMREGHRAEIQRLQAKHRDQMDSVLSALRKT